MLAAKVEAFEEKANVHEEKKKEQRRLHAEAYRAQLAATAKAAQAGNIRKR